MKRTEEHLSKVPLTVVIVSYDSRPDLERCLPTLFAPGSPEVSVLVIDNHGADGVSDWLEHAWPAVQVVRNPCNSGYAGGNNVGLALVDTPYTLILNPDTEVAAGALAALLQAARAQPFALITPKLLRPDGRVNACGNEMHYTGLVWCLGLGQPAEQYAGLQPVPLLSGAAIIGRTEVFRDLGGFDEQLFMYYEDTDLSLRAKLRGYRLFCLADAEITHHYALNMTPGKLYQLERNRLLTLFKVLSGQTLRQLLPALLLTEAATWSFSVRGWSYVRARARVYGWLWRHRSELRQVRSEVQRTRLCSDAELLGQSSLALPIGQVSAPALGRLVNAVFVPIYRLLKPATLRRKPQGPALLSRQS